MKKAKKLFPALVLSSVLGASGIIAGASLTNNSISNNSVSKNVDNQANSRSSSYTADYTGHTVNGIQLQNSNQNLTQAAPYFWNFWTNMDQKTGSFIAGQPAIIMITTNPGSYTGYNYLQSPGSGFSVIEQDGSKGQYLCVAETPTVGTHNPIVFLMAKGEGGPSMSCSFTYNVISVIFNSLSIAGPKTYGSGSNFDLTSNLVFSQDIDQPLNQVFEWFQIINGVESLIQGQNTCTLTSPVPDVNNGTILQVKCKTTWNGVTKNTSAINIDITNGSAAGSSNILTQWYLWVPIGLGVVVIAISVIAIILAKNKRKMDIQTRQIRNINSVRLSSIPSVKQLGSPSTVPTKKQTTVQGPSPMPQAGPAPVQSAGGQKVNLQRPVAKQHAKINVEDPSKSLAPKHKE